MFPRPLFLGSRFGSARFRTREAAAEEGIFPHVCTCVLHCFRQEVDLRAGFQTLECTYTGWR